MQTAVLIKGSQIFLHRQQGFAGICLIVTCGCLSLVSHMVQLGGVVILDLPGEKLHESCTF